VGQLENQLFMKTKLRKPFFLAKKLQKLLEKKEAKGIMFSFALCLCLPLVESKPTFRISIPILFQCAPNDANQ
jgi:hypothetical protein